MNAPTGPVGRATVPAANRRDSAPPAPPRQTMRAIVQAGYGSADVLHLAEIGRPAAGDGEVLLRVHAAGLDRGTWHLMAGQPYLIRLASGLRAPYTQDSGPGPGRGISQAIQQRGLAHAGLA